MRVYVSSRRYFLCCVRILATFLLLVLIWIVFASSCMLSAFAHTTGQTSLGDRHELERFMDGVMNRQMAANHIPGAAFVVVKDGRVLLEKGYGYADLQRGIKVDPAGTLFRSGSISKLFTWIAVMQLVEAGKIDLRANVNTYLKGFRIPDTYPRPITVENLMTHTAGFEDGTIGQLVPQASDLERLGTWLPQHIPARIFSPGTVTAYSDYGAALAGYIVEQVSGLPFEQYIERHIFQPLHMNQSSFRQPLPAVLAQQMSQGYIRSGGVYHAQSFENIETVPAGALSTTASDMARFMLALLQKGHLGNERILQEATMQEMEQQHFANDARLPGMDYGFYEQQINSQHLIGHSGDTTLFYSLLMLLPEQHAGIFVSFNSHSGSTASKLLLQAFMDHYYPAPATNKPLPLAGFSERSSQIGGSYWSTRRNETTYQKIGYDLLPPGPVTVNPAGNGHITIKGLSNQDMDMIEVSPWVFKSANGPDDTVAFREDGGRMSMFDGNRPYQAYQQIAWYDTPIVHYSLWLICLFAFLLMDFLWLLRFVCTIFSQKRLAFGFPYWLGWIVGNCNIAVLVWLVLLFTSDDVYVVQFAQSPALVAATVLASISSLLTIGLIFCNILVWRQRLWNVWQLFVYAVLTLAAIAFSLDLNFWHLLWLP